ncbi:ferritin-like domain-containing protein [Cellulophaga omnivescoria]|uniref:ferritin-like domain-containing protein n=1 Tax=Cellulophaga omnivescoria TaxID=1888890 RepID=UPI000985243E|nr:PA2169 family four-helix-bundle protein [Cellulophaga omnivescoria]WBU88668.1 PA2169 family four-helix-bundle protein [Cellulophaga omnivescoria]WKB80643.1 PA2169 family four-helix-bundle protein [Cellulophaga lytica]
MTTYTEQVGTKLNNLLEKTYDAEKGYKKAAENTDHGALKTYFNKRSKERYDFGHELKTEIAKFGEEPEKGGSLTGTMHRAWMDTKAFFAADDAESMLEESIRGEKAAVEEYENVLKDTTLPSSTATVLLKQMNNIKSDLNTIKFLEDIS